MQEEKLTFYSQNRYNRYNKYNRNNNRNNNKYKQNKKEENIFTKKKESKDKFKVVEKEFPTLNNNIIEEKEKEKEKEKLDFKILNFDDDVEYIPKKKVKDGWIILNKENLEKRKKEKLELSNRINIKEINKMYTKMIKNWEKFREDENILMGDRSRFWNNKVEIEKMIEEEKMIEKEIADYNEDKKNNKLDENSDNEISEIVDNY
jgi:hypothetical protein